MIRATDATLPYGAVTNEATSGWAVIHIPTLQVLGDALYATEDDALTAARAARDRAVAEDRANRFFDEERWIRDRLDDAE